MRKKTKIRYGAAKQNGWYLLSKTSSNNYHQCWGREKFTDQHPPMKDYSLVTSNTLKIITLVHTHQINGWLG